MKQDKNYIDEKNELLFNSFIYTINAPEIDKFIRAKIIKEYMNDNKISMREFSKKFKISNSTVQDWCVYNNLSTEKYKEFIKNGMTASEIYRMIRNNRKHNLEEYKEIDKHIDTVITLLNSTNIKNSYSKYTYEKLNDLSLAINRCKFKLETFGVLK
jgi:DNA-binding transcriptional regulator YiaG